MRVLDTETGQFVEIDPEATNGDWDWKTPVYAILSHTWDENGKQSYQELKKIQRRYKFTSCLPVPRTPPSGTLARLRELPSKMLRHAIWHDCNLSPKIRDACRIARENGYRYIWIDSCCIDKSSSSELSEAINSMYKWYGLAGVCYAYLSDVPYGEDHSAEDSVFRWSRWFRRGWTLQELIAPLSVEFLSKEWAPIGSKHALVDLVESITKIDYKALLHLEPLDTFSVAQRLSWAASWETTRVEDHAYSLLGIFDINMPTLYGEGDHAFRRLQEQIIQHTPDQSLFAWDPFYLNSLLPKNLDSGDTSNSNGLRTQVRKYSDRNDSDERQHLFARSPGRFEDCKSITAPLYNTIHLPSHLSRHEIEYTSTPYGIRTQFWMIHLTQDLHSLRTPLHNADVQLRFPDLLEDSEWYLVILRCEHQEQPGHLLGRVCYTSPSETNVPFIHAGYVNVASPQGESPGMQHDLVPLSHKTIEQCRPQTELKTVYIPHPDGTNLLSIHRRQPYTALKFVLLRPTRDTLRSQGYSADLRNPDPDHPTTHWLTLSNDEHTITIKFYHTLEDDGKVFSIMAKVRMSGSRVRLDSAPDADQAERHTVDWSNFIWYRRDGWSTKLDQRKVSLGAAGAGTLTVNLGLDFGGQGYYILHVNVLNDASPSSSGVEPAVDEDEEEESTEEGSSSGENDTDYASAEDLEVTGGREDVPSGEDRDVVSPSDNTEDGDGEGVLA